MRKLLLFILILAFLCNCATLRPSEKKAGVIEVRTGGTINISGICRGDIIGDGKGPYLKSVPSAEIVIDGKFVGRTPVKKLNVASGSHLIELKANGYKTSSIRLNGILSSGGIWKINGVKASGHKKFTIKSGGGLIITLKKQ